MIRQVACLLLTILAVTTSVHAGDQPAADNSAPRTIQFNRDIRPLLSDNCFFCHGPDNNRREANLRLDTQQGLLGNRNNIGAIIPGSPETSALIERVEATDPEVIMPPPDSGKSLTDEQIQLLKDCINQGGEFEGHWSFLPVNTKHLTEHSDDATTTAEMIDQLVNVQRKAHGLTSASQADRVTLYRRLSLDLTGLPPAADDVQAFVSDQSPQAWEKAVDRLLESPHFGERMAVWWLDLVRYADSVGYHGDQEVSVSPYRDYVIRSFNSNKSFDQFTREQLAGDLMPAPSQELLVASGYNRLGMMSAEGGVQPKEYLAKYIAERVRNATGTWLGITLGCAECHDHKFDPLTTQDFYRFEAFFADIREKGLYSGGGPADRWGPSMRVPTPQQQQQQEEGDQQESSDQQGDSEQSDSNSQSQEQSSDSQSQSDSES
ncbi:MAG: DUF1549 domain-containing protein, partial [Planctomycetaceae bacterium]